IIPVLLLLAPPKIAGYLGPGDMFEPQELRLEASPDAPARATFEYGAELWDEIPVSVRNALTPIMESMFDELCLAALGKRSNANLIAAALAAGKRASAVIFPECATDARRPRPGYQGEPPTLR